MRIISGKLGGRVLKVPGNLPVRPTTDRTKEALFNIIAAQKEMEGISVLDICCGTGNIGIEFFSRGADCIIAVDKDRRCVAAVKDLFKSLGIENGKVIQAEAGKFAENPLKYLPEETRQFDMIFMDPPYALPNQQEIILKLFSFDLLKPDGWLILEHSSLLSFSAVKHYLFTRKYGSSSLSFFGENPDTA
ncbi:MAG: 16S rRNA (guanine(966)-N(2))-methyltransferase RsmD [Bacteroidia bacterium]|nr:16S rRNA (guanine(966)-N(2))-methyltransferase RsmD [Bacteroidia bacterium]